MKHLVAVLVVSFARWVTGMQQPAVPAPPSGLSAPRSPETDLGHCPSRPEGPDVDAMRLEETGRVRLVLLMPPTVGSLSFESRSSSRSWTRLRAHGVRFEARDRRVRTDTRQNRFEVFLPQLPRVDGDRAVPGRTLSLGHVDIEGEQVALSVDRPVVVVTEPDAMTVEVRG